MEGIVTSTDVSAGERLSANTIGLAVGRSKLELSGESKTRWLATVVLFDRFQRRMIFSPVSATNSGGRIMVVIPYQLKPKGTMLTTGGLLAISGGAVRKGWK